MLTHWNEKTQKDSYNNHHNKRTISSNSGAGILARPRTCGTQKHSSLAEAYTNIPLTRRHFSLSLSMFAFWRSHIIVDVNKKIRMNGHFFLFLLNIFTRDCFWRLFSFCYELIKTHKQNYRKKRTKPLFLLLENLFCSFCILDSCQFCFVHMILHSQ